MNEIEEIKSKINIIDFIGEYIRLTRAGSSFKGLCPFHNEKTPSFNVSEERQRFHCFGCGKGGDIFTFLMEMEGLEFREALETLAERAGVEHKKGNAFSQEKNTNTKNIYTLLQEATSFYEKQLWEEQGVKALGYVKSRGIDDETLKQFRIGFTPSGWHTTQTFLLGRGFNEQDIVNAGLVVQKEEDTSFSKRHTYDRFRERIMFPVFDPLGRVVGYSARVLPGENEKNAKYINTPETSVYHKSRIMYGLFQAKEYIKKERKVIVVEGNMDVLAMHKSGFKNTVAVSGTSLTQEHFTLLKRYAREVVFFFDSDVAGQQAMKKSVEMGYCQDVPSSVVTITKGKDAADMALEYPQELQEAVQNARPSMEYFLDVWAGEYDLSEAEGKKYFAQEALFMISAMTDDVEISHWMSRVASMLNVEIDTLYSLLGKKKQESYGKEYMYKERKEESSFTENKDRLEILDEKASAFCFFYSKVWEYFTKEYAEHGGLEYVAKDTLFSKILSLGEKSDYSFEGVRLLLENTLRSRAEKAYHDLEIEQLEKGPLSFEEAKKEILYLQREMEKEFLRRTIKKTQQKIYDAEKDKKQDTVRELSEEMIRLLKRIHSA